MADITAMLSSGSGHYGTPAHLCDRVHEFYNGMPRLDPATNPDAYMRASNEWGLSFQLESESIAFEKLIKKKTGVERPLTSREWDALEAFGRDWDRRAAERGIEIVDSLADDVQWEGPGWINPDYNDVARFMRRLACEALGEWLALIVARTSARWFQRYIFGRTEENDEDYAEGADAVLFFDKRLVFTLDGKETTSAPFDSVLAYYTDTQLSLPERQEQAERFKETFSDYGKVIIL